MHVYAVSTSATAQPAAAAVGNGVAFVVLARWFLALQCTYSGWANMLCCCLLLPAAG
jgi:hypothetical protein